VGSLTSWGAGGETSDVSLVVVVLLVALLLGCAFGGSVERLGALPLRSRRLLLAAVLTQLLGALVGGPVHAVGLAGSAALVVAFLARNRGIRGTGLVALGLTLNAAVVAANGAMPVSAEAAGRAGVGTQDLLRGGDPRHELAGPETRLRQLGDVVPVPLPLRPEVVSPGDVLLAAGLGQLVVLAMLGRATTSTAGSTAGLTAGSTAGRTAGSSRPNGRRRGRRPLPALPPHRPTDRPRSRQPVRGTARRRDADPPPRPGHRPGGEPDAAA
jgi:hypothetical protein